MVLLETLQRDSSYETQTVQENTPKTGEADGMCHQCLKIVYSFVVVVVLITFLLTLTRYLIRSNVRT